MDTNLVTLAKLMAVNQSASIPIAIQITTMIISFLTPIMLVVVLKIQQQTKNLASETHTIVNGQRMEMQASIKKLEEDSKAAAAAVVSAQAEKKAAEAMRDAIIEATRLSRPLEEKVKT